MARMTEGPQHPDQPEQPPQYGQPAPYPGYGQQPHPAPPPYGDQAWAGGNDPVPPRRPATVTTACILAWVFSGMTLVLAGFILMGAAVNRDAAVDQLREDPRYDQYDVDPEQLMNLMAGVSVVALVLSVAAIVAAVLAFRGSSAGRIVLAICAGLSAVVSLVAVLACVPIVTLIASVAAVVLLFTGGANEWYRSRRA